MLTKRIININIDKIKEMKVIYYVRFGWRVESNLFRDVEDLGFV